MGRTFGHHGATALIFDVGIRPVSAPQNHGKTPFPCNNPYGTYFDHSYPKKQARRNKVTVPRENRCRWVRRIGPMQAQNCIIGCGRRPIGNRCRNLKCWMPIRAHCRSASASRTTAAGAQNSNRFRVTTLGIRVPATEVKAALCHRRWRRSLILGIRV